jgi:hypothetical protein
MGSGMKSAAGRWGGRGLVAVSAWALLAGCGGGDGEVPAVPAAGTVTYQGKPVEKGTVYFLPEKGHPATGAIEGGKFTLTTYKEGDGAIPGKHGVGVAVTEAVPTKDGDTAEKYVVPQKYADPGSSKISVDIPAGGKTDIVIDVPK